MTSNELIDKFKTETSLVKGGVLIFWDLNFGKHGDNYYKIESIETNDNIITVQTSYPKIEIWDVKDIIEHTAKNDFWPPRLEFCGPARMRLEYIFQDKIYFADFHFRENKLTTETNSDLFENGIRLVNGDNFNVIIFE